MSAEYIPQKQDIDKVISEKPFLKSNEVIHKLLEDAIMGAKIPAGAKINASAIAKVANLSITPVRSAIKQLVDEGYLVEDATAKCYRVFDISDSMLEQIFDARMMIEGTASYLCAQKHAVLDLKPLKCMAEEFRDLWLCDVDPATSMETARKRVNIDRAFHNAIIRATGNIFIIEYYNRLSKSLTYSLIKAMDFWDANRNDRNSREILAGHHLSIYNAIANGLPDVARATAENHMDFAKLRCINYRSKCTN